MSMSLSQFIEESREEIQAFEAWWQEQHRLAPEMYPMEFPEDNAGLWWEMLETFVAERPDKQRGD